MTPSDSITIVIKLFAAYQEAYQRDELTWHVPPNSTVSTVLDRCIADHPNLAPWRDRTRFGINLEFVEPDAPLQDGDEVVLIPPVSGG
ncbi:MoaD/ThiS family protein [Sodalinema gerasimenkoae]|uniref:MoaD/ThiS family protein n=1 Tax=Sodalinema gerasimenkoae TaxID=2862348 RepID=UPI00135B480C|nr:MoaD/ThiS family protein [Sodalinema gerasimenkoae]